MPVVGSTGGAQKPWPSEIQVAGRDQRPGRAVFEIDKSGSIANGGLISLDGIHPTTCGYGLIAQEFINVMKAKNPGIQNINFEEIRYWDSLVTKPSRTLDDVFGMLKTLEKWFHISRIFK